MEHQVELNLLIELVDQAKAEDIARGWPAPIPAYLTRLDDTGDVGNCSRRSTADFQGVLHAFCGRVPPANM
jgi:hypothetical protein